VTTRRLAVTVLTLAILFAAGHGAAAGDEHPTPTGGSCRWFMVEADTMMEEAGGGERLANLCERAHRDGYNGLLFWDSNLWARRLPRDYMQNARTLRRTLDRLHFTLMIEMCPRGVQMLTWSGDPSIVEPRAANPTPEERNYRYICLAHPDVIPIWEEQIRRAEEIYHPDGWLLGGYDEIRVACADERCRRSGKTPAELLAEHVRAALAMVRRTTPGRVVAVWNDMFDPYHNAKPGGYYHVRQGFSGAWEGIDKDVLILNWNDRIESYRFWAARGNPQIFAGFYDGELSRDKEAHLVRQARAYPGVIGWMYTTWKANFSVMRPYLALSGFRPSPGTRPESDLPALFLKAPKPDASQADDKKQDSLPSSAPAATPPKPDDTQSADRKDAHDDMSTGNQKKGDNGMGTGDGKKDDNDSGDDDTDDGDDWGDDGE